MRQQTGEPRISCEADLGELMVVGSQEAKALVLGGMRPGVAYGQTALHTELFLDPQGPEPVFTGSGSTQMDYCDLSLAPAGCVVRAPGEREKKYKLTDLGAHEGRAYAGHVLTLSLEAGDIGLRALYGMARTYRGKDSLPPLDRLRIFRKLLTSSDLQARDITEELGVSSNTVKRNIAWMEKYGLVSYEGIDQRDYGNHVIYTLPEDFDVDDGGHEVQAMIYGTIRRLIADGTRQPTLTEFIEALHEQHPDAGFDQRVRRATATTRMNKLAAAKEIGKNVATGRRRSTVVLLESARPIVERSVAIADGMLSGDPEFIEDGKGRMRHILRDQEAVRALISKAFNDSPEANGMPQEDRVRLVTGYLEERRGVLSEMAASLEEDGMTYFSVRSTLIQMRSDSLAISQPVDGQREHEWSLVPQEAALAA